MIISYNRLLNTIQIFQIIRIFEYLKNLKNDKKMIKNDTKNINAPETKILNRTRFRREPARGGSPLETAL